MIRRVSVKALAKINLDLRVLHKRQDGFHELRTVFQTISLADSIEISYEPAGRTALEIEDEKAIPDNLVIRAARAALDAMKIRAQVRFRLKKKIPMGAGLGGGSSDAAAILLALPVLAGKAIPARRLNGIASVLGSDVPFFLSGGTALGVDRGTELYPLEDLRQEPVLMVSPDVHVSTAAAYQTLGRNLTFTGTSDKINGFQVFVSALAGGRSAKAASRFSENDFESAVFSQYPQLRTLFGKLRKVAGGARMTGSGSAFFVLFDSKAERDLARKSLDGDRVFRSCRVLPSNLVSRRAYQQTWRRQLSAHLVPGDLSWPPRSRYEQ